ncbi:MAG: TIGR01777 family oxidoreductase [Thermoanaerobaculia bacterium]|nr:TIGR01777 family oxidoreductase [Thermoanaerobaculia bacterium]
MKIVIPGGSGQVGTLLARDFHAKGHEVVVLSRKPQNTPWISRSWDGATAGPWFNEIDGADVVINLAGRSVDCRYTAANRRAIMDSRVRSTQIVGESIQRANNPPPVWLQASTATLYAHRFDASNDEATGLIGGDEHDKETAEPPPSSWSFSIDVAKAWEATANRFVLPTTRTVLLRSAMIMSPDRGGIFDTLVRLTRLGLGGTAGSGKQYISWIHEADFIHAIERLIDEDFVGAINVAAPNPIPNAEFMRTLRDAWGCPIGLPAKRWMLEIGAFFLRTETELLLKSRRVVPGRLLEAGFGFEFPTWHQAVRDLRRRSRSKPLESLQETP